MDNSVYYLTGMGGRLDTGLGQGLLSRGFEIAGRELVGEFRRLDFQQQVDLVVSDLQSNFWQEDARVIANSFGAYLFLHAQAQMDPYIGKVILLSPIVGEFSNEETRMNFIPPRADKLLQLAKASSFPIPKQCEVHVGSEDWQSNPVNVTTFGSMLGIDVTVVPNAGHMLPKEYVGDLLDKWLATD
jgi:alpha-beta hydrolase superfamily lysophospholipase